MKIMQYAISSRISRQVLYHLRNKSVISDPLSAADRLFLERLEKIWGDPNVLRAQVAKLGRARRQALVDGASLAEKWERYCLARYRSCPPGSRLQIDQLIQEIEKYFGFSPDRDAIQRIRNRAQKLRQRSKTAPSEAEENL